MARKGQTDIPSQTLCEANTTKNEIAFRNLIVGYHTYLLRIIETTEGSIPWTIIFDRNSIST